MSEPTITCAKLDDQLADYLEGGLDARQRAAMDRHLATCARCAAMLAALDERPAAAAALPTLTPPRDLWAGVAARIESRVLPLSERGPEVPPARQWRIAGMAAAAVVLITASAAITREILVRGTLAGSTGTAYAPGGASASRLVSRHEALIRTYDGEIARLDSVVRLRRSDLDTTTVKIIEKNLRVIDAAIAESRAALANDPHSHFLNDQLTHVLDQKVELLRTVALLPTRT